MVKLELLHLLETENAFDGFSGDDIFTIWDNQASEPFIY